MYETAFPCPDCNRELAANARRCECGWTAPKRAAVRTRDAHAEATNMLTLWKRNSRRWPPTFPADPSAAAQWFISILEPAHPHWDRPRETPTRDADTTHVEFPYVDRVLYCLRRYLAAGEDLQLLVASAAEEGIPYRGDDMDTFERMLPEYRRMHEQGARSYIADAIRRMKTMQLWKPMPGADTDA